MSAFALGDRVRYIAGPTYSVKQHVGKVGTVIGRADNVESVLVNFDHNGRERGCFASNLERVTDDRAPGWGWVAEGLSKHMDAVVAEFGSDDVTQPSHYDWIPGIECKDVVKHFPFMRGAAMKYLWRAGRKGDTAKHLQDLRKAVECITNEIKDIEAK